MTSAILQAINGVSLAALLFLLASGFTLSFGLMRVVNMAHGAYYLLGGYIGLTIAERTGSFALALAGGGAAIVVLGYLIDRFLIRRTGENHLAQVLLTVGVAFVLGDAALYIWGGDNLMVVHWLYNITGDSFRLRSCSVAAGSATCSNTSFRKMKSNRVGSLGKSA